MKYTVRLIEAIRRDRYPQLQDDMFTYFVDMDPTPNKEYAQWIILNFFKKYKDTIDYVMKKANTNEDNTETDRYKYPLSLRELKLITTVSRGSNLGVAGVELGRFLREDDYKVSENLEKYHILKTKGRLSLEQKNISNIKGFIALDDLVESFVDEFEKIEMEAISTDESDKWFEDKEWLVVVPLTERAACKYGANTKWCTAATGSNNMFDHYNKDGPLIVIINKPSGDKYQLHFYSNQWKDVRDHELESRKEFLATLPSPLKQVIYDKTSKIEFYPDIDGLINRLSAIPEFRADVNKRGVLDGRYLLGAWESADDRDTDRQYATYPMSHEMMEQCIYMWASEQDNYDSYDYGWDNPDKFLNEKPAGEENEDGEIDWSDEQREEAGSMSMDGSIEQFGYDISRACSTLSYAKNEYGKKRLEEILDKATEVIEYPTEKINVPNEMTTMLSSILETDEETYYSSADNLTNVLQVWLHKQNDTTPLTIHTNYEIQHE